jgi:hypothetical protein
MELISGYPISMLVLVVFGSVGAFDEFYYHNHKLKLFSRAQSYRENITHVARVFVYTFLFWGVANYDFHGSSIYIMYAILFCDIVVAFWDILEEPTSRKDIGGLPTGEYLLHMYLSFVLGIFYYNYALELWANRNMPFKIAAKSFNSNLIQYVLSGMAMASLILFIYGVYSLFKFKQTQKS